jgi:beta-phosphoglucomutase-like phosphatase (HAD superfamily)
MSQLIIFDMDGVLVDSETLACTMSSWRRSASS